MNFEPVLSLVKRFVDRYREGGSVHKKFASLIVAAVILGAVTLAEAQQQAKVHKLGWLGTRPTTSTGGQEAIRRMLLDLGYAEGKNISFRV